VHIGFDGRFVLDVKSSTGLMSFFNGQLCKDSVLRMYVGGLSQCDSPRSAEIQIKASAMGSKRIESEVDIFFQNTCKVIDMVLP
jgi:hypothetical protein